VHVRLLVVAHQFAVYRPDSHVDEKAQDKDSDAHDQQRSLRGHSSANVAKVIMHSLCGADLYYKDSDSYCSSVHFYTVLDFCPSSFSSML